MKHSQAQLRCPCTSLFIPNSALVRHSILTHWHIECNSVQRVVGNMLRNHPPTEVNYHESGPADGTSTDTPPPPKHHWENDIGPGLLLISGLIKWAFILRITVQEP